jgi:HEAT repeat protein
MPRLSDIFREMLLWLQPPPSRVEAAAPQNAEPGSEDFLREAVMLMRSLPADELPALEVMFRSNWPYRHGTFDAEVLRDPGHSSDTDVLGLLSFHPNGHVREEAVKRLALLGDRSELPYLLLRLNDWVPAVREAARRPVLDRMRDDYVAAFLHNFSLVDRVLRARRTDGSFLVEPLTRILETAAGQAAMLALIASGSRARTRAAVRFVMDRVPSLLRGVAAAGVTATDPVIRMWMTPVIASSLPPEQALPILQRLATDSTPAVRREAVRALAQAFPREAQHYLERAALDTSPSVRETSRFLLRERQIDFVAVYRTALETAATTRALATAIAGLAEVGAASDAGRASPYLSHPSPSVRRAAVKCVMRLAGEGFAERVTPMLHDPAPAVSAAVRDALRQHAQTLVRSQLAGIFTAASSGHTRANVVPLFAALSKWQSVTCLLDAAASPDEKVAGLARRYLHDWNRRYNRRQAQPSARELEALTTALATAGTVDRRITDEIRFALRSFS